MTKDHEKKIKVVVIDDEKPARDGLIGVLKMNFPNLEIIGEANSVVTGVLMLKSLKPDVVFLDIQLSDGSGFNLLEQLDQIEFQVIFVTAYNSFAINAFKVNALDYVLKPAGIEDLTIAIDKLNKRTALIDSDSLDEIKNNWIKKNSSTSKLAIREFDGVRYLRIDQITRCQSYNNYTEIHLVNGERIMTTKTLKDYTEILENYGFFRIYQSHLINLKMVKKILNKEGLYVEMENGDVLELSRRKKNVLFERMSEFQI